MTTEHDEALVERVALAMARIVERSIPDDWDGYPCLRAEWGKQARAIIYPPKTKLEVARELLMQARDHNGFLTTPAVELALLAALSLEKMED